MGPLGVPEMLFILVLVLLIFGPKRLPEVGRMVGKGLGEFRRASNELKRSIQTELAIEELEETPGRRPLPPRVRPVRMDPDEEGEAPAAAPGLAQGDDGGVVAGEPAAAGQGAAVPAADAGGRAEESVASPAPPGVHR